MNSHPLAPEASASGAPVAEGQVTGVGGLAPGRRIENDEIRITEIEPVGVIIVSARTEPSVELDEEKMRVWDEIEEACSPLLIGTIVLRRYGAGEKEVHTYTVFKKYVDLAFAQYNRRTKRSLERVKKVCREAERKRVVDYVYLARGIISDLENSKSEELRALASWLSTATFSELMSYARGVVELLRKNGYDATLRKLAQLVDDASRLSVTLFFETVKIEGKGRNGIALLS